MVCVLSVYVASAPRAVPGGDSGRTAVSHMCLCLYHMQPITEQQIVISHSTPYDTTLFEV